MLLPYLILICIVGFAIYWLLKPAIKRYYTRKVFNKEFPPAWLEYLYTRIPLYQRLPTHLQRELQGHINVFIADKEFIGCEDLVITDEIRVTIAAQACILLLNRPSQYYPTLKTIIVYPSAYIAKTIEQDGPLEETDLQVRLGESWLNGPVVLSWDHAKHGASDIYDAKNVVLHEFAHQLDGEDGSCDGVPALSAHSNYVSWARVCSKQYSKLVKDVERGTPTTIDAYGATNPAEFFAVVTETFFEKPLQLKKKHPALYQHMQGYYKVDPIEWLHQ